VRTISESDTVVSENRGMAYDLEDEGFVGAILTDRSGGTVGDSQEWTSAKVRLQAQFSRLCTSTNKVWGLASFRSGSRGTGILASRKSRALNKPRFFFF
jgi:hypothetical protein